MKKSEMIEHIAAEMCDAYRDRKLSGETEDAYWKRKATDLLDMLLGFGMLPPQRRASDAELNKGLYIDEYGIINEWEPE